MAGALYLALRDISYLGPEAIGLGRREVEPLVGG